MPTPSNSKEIPARVTVRLLGIANRLTAPLMVNTVQRSDAEWQRLLTAEQYQITRRRGTEAAFCGKFYDHKKTGLYSCVCCRLPLFASNAKFDSGTGWPSFFSPLAQENIRSKEDRSYGMVRTEILCTRCDAHLGHVFEDGPSPGGLRYCLNSDSLFFTEMELPALGEAPDILPQATFGAGCFWGVEAAFQELEGVVSTSVGYTGGKTANPTYEQVCTDRTGHAEAVEVIYDPSLTSYTKLLQLFWSIHDPTTLNRQGPDFGTQYRSVIFFHNPEQEAAARQSLEQHQPSGEFRRPIVTQIVPATVFYRAEEYHQLYLKKRGLQSCAPASATH